MATKVLGLLTAATLATVVSTAAGAANAASLVSASSTSYKVTDIVNEQISVQKFDSSLGTLKGVKIDFTGDMEGEAGFENRSATAADIFIKLAGSLNLKFNGQTLFELAPERVTGPYAAAAYDGVTDYGGASGKTITGLEATKSASKTFTDSTFLQSFVGTGNLSFLFSAFATSNVTGSGNMRSFVDTFAKANVKVTYDYDPAKSVPEPSGILGIGVIGGMAFLSQRKKKQFQN